jgi:hypothetical protein
LYVREYSRHFAGRQMQDQGGHHVRLMIGPRDPAGVIARTLSLGRVE